MNDLIIPAHKGHASKPTNAYQSQEAKCGIIVKHGRSREK